jgi:hypothetical protein
MRRVYIAMFMLAFIFNSCISIKRPFFNRSSIEIKEGYLSLKNINQNLEKQMPIVEKIGSNEIKIVSVTTFASDDGKSLVTEVEFIFTSFQIPEGLPAIARVRSSIEYNPRTKEFKFARISAPEIKFLKESLLEYVTPQQRKFIPDTIVLKLYSLVLHKSKRALRPMQSFSVKEGKIKIVFR